MTSLYHRTVGTLRIAFFLVTTGIRICAYHDQYSISRGMALTSEAESIDRELRQAIPSAVPHDPDVQMVVGKLNAGWTTMISTGSS